MGVHTTLAWGGERMEDAGMGGVGNGAHRAPIAVGKLEVYNEGSQGPCHEETMWYPELGGATQSPWPGEGSRGL